MTAYRVLVVTNLWPTESDPGYGSFVHAQMESLRPLGVEFDTLFFDGRASRWNYLRGIRRMRACLRQKPYDLIHAHFGLSGWVARCQFRLPVVVSFMGDDVLGRFSRNGRITPMGHFLRISSFLLARIVSRVIVKSRAMKERLRLGRAYVIPNGVDLNLFLPADQRDARGALGLDTARKFVLFPYDPGIQNKCHHLVASAVHLARRSIPEIEILYARGVPRQQMPIYMNAADLLVLASFSEGSPNAVKEAMAVNLPVVTVDVGDAREIVNGVDGCFVVSREVEEIAGKIVEVCRRGLRTRGRDSIRRLSIESVAQRIVEVYATLASAHPQRSRQA